MSVDTTTLLYKLWGKTNERDKGYTPEKWQSHPAICHMVDVGFVAHTWMEANPRILQRFGELAPSIDTDALQHIITTLAALHDLGKLHMHFQAKSPVGWGRGYGVLYPQEKPDGTHFDHGCATAAIIKKYVPTWAAWLPAVRAVAAHHGSFHDNGTIRGIPALYREKPLIRQAVSLIEQLFLCPESLPPLPTGQGFSMYLAGFVSVADWFGSNSFLFPFANGIQSDSDMRIYYGNLRRDVVVAALRDAGLLPSFSRKSHSFSSLFGFSSLHPLQELATQVPFGEQPGPEIAIAEAPMGVGKTEIALYLTARALYANTVSGLYVDVPTQASADALLKRIRHFATAMADNTGSVSYMLAHGGRYYHDEFAKKILRAGDNGNNENNADALPSEIVAPAWLLSSKRVLLASVGVGTIDQAMLGVLSVRHMFVRLFALADKVVVFDEIHAYDAYMNTIILALLRWLYALGVKVLLLSATLPHSLRMDFLRAYNADAPPRTTTYEPYPLLLHAHGTGTVRVYTPSTTDFSQQAHPATTVELHSIGNEMRSAEGAKLAAQLAEKGGCVAWIRNTVNEAQEAYNLLCKLCEGTDIEVEILHARFVRGDRTTKESSIIDRLGKATLQPPQDGLPAPQRPKRFILIATQVIEQSVDIDFDAMISDVAPIDLLLQRAGRLWRHLRPKEQRFDHTSPVLHVLLPTPGECHALAYGSSGYIYNTDILARTTALLAQEQHQQWAMPDACRVLVAEAYDNDENYWTAARLNVDEKTLREQRTAHTNNIRSMQSAAERITISNATDSGAIAMATAVFSDDDHNGHIAITTRYAFNTATLVLLRQHNGTVYLEGDPTYQFDTPPADDDTEARLRFERAIALSTVSFPWYATGKELQHSSAPLPTSLIQWWRKHHPYDNKIFVLVGSDGSIEHEQFIASYKRRPNGIANEGLTIQIIRPLSNTVKPTEIL